MTYRSRSCHRSILLAASAVALASSSLAWGADAGTYETITNYDGYIIRNRPVVTAWYGQRIALVVDGETADSAAARDPATMSQIVAALDNLFISYEQVTGFTDFPIARALDGRITIESSSSIGGGLAHHGVLGIGVGDGYFEGQYNRVNSGDNAYHQVFFYETARNYWGPVMQKIDYATSNSPDSWGWWTVGFNNAMASLMPRHPIPGITDLSYNGQNGQHFRDGMLGYLSTYLSSPDYTWENSWNRDRLPWDQNTSVNDLMSGLVIQLSEDYAAGGTAIVQGLYREIPRVPDLATDHSDSAGARDNFYIAASRAAGVDLRSYFTDTLRWEIRPEADANYHRWTGGGATGDWDNRANWRTLSAMPPVPDGAAINVAIDGQHNTLIDLKGDRTVKTLRFAGLTAAPFTLMNSVEGAKLTVADGGGISRDISEYTGIQTIATPIHFAGDATLTNNSTWSDGNNRLIISGPISGAGNLTITGRAPHAIGDGGVDLAGDNAGFTGSITLQVGRLYVGGSSALGSGNAPLTIEGGNLLLADGVTLTKPIVVVNFSSITSLGSGTIKGDVTIEPGAVWRVQDTLGAMELNGRISGSGRLDLYDGPITVGGIVPNTLTGAFNLSRSAVLTLAKVGGNAVAGPLDIANTSTVILAGDDQIADTSLVRLNNGSKLQLRGFSDHVGGLSDITNTSVIENAGAGNSVLTLGNNTSNSYAYKGTIRDNGPGVSGGSLSLTKTGTNTQILQWENSYTGPTLIEGGTLELQEIGSINFSSGITVSGGRLAARGSTTVDAPIELAGGTLAGDGRARTVMVTSGRISPGDGLGSAATLRIDAMTMTGNSILEMDLGVASDSITMSGNLVLDGTLNVSAMAGDALEGRYTLVRGFTSLVDNGLSLGSMPGDAAYTLTVDASSREVYLTANPMTMVVPEPGSAVALLLAGSVLLGRCPRRRPAPLVSYCHVHH